MSAELGRDDVLDDFAMETPLGPEILRNYIEKYPSLALELVDLYHELLMVDLSAAADGIQLETKSSVEISQRDATAVANALSGSNLRYLAKSLGLPRDFLSGFRDRKVRLGSIPGALITNLARLAGVHVHQLVTHLQGAAGPVPHMAHKADGKPQGSATVDYDDFIAGLGLDDGELEGLKRLCVSDGSD